MVMLKESYLLVLADIAVKLYLDRDIMPWELPGVEVKPIVGDFDLIPIDNLLLEDSIPVTESITPRRII